MIQVLNQELYVFGKLIGRHPEFPWLFSITDVYKACEIPLKREAKKYGKDPHTTFVSKRPNTWLAKNTKEQRIDAVAHEVRKRIKKYGVNCGFASVMTDAAIAASVSNKDLCVQIKKGGSTKGTYIATQGTYVAQDLVLSYAGFLNEKLQARINSTFISVLNGYTEEVTKKVEKNERIAKGTQTRRENKQLNDELVEACGAKKLLPMKVQEGINEGVLGLPAMKYKKMHGIKEPFNDNLSDEQVCMKNIGIALSTLRIRKHEKSELSHKEGKHIGLTSGQYARRITLEAVQA
jgi:hypothetical protein